MDLVNLCYLKVYCDCLNILYKINLIQYNYRLYKHKNKYNLCLCQIIEIGVSPPFKQFPLLKNGGYFYRVSKIEFQKNIQ